MSHWANDFVGLPWLAGGRSRSGLDCWGIVHLVYREALDIALPSYDGSDPAALADNAPLFDAAAKEPWRIVPMGDEREFDVGLFRVGAHPCHVGVVTRAGRMLHVQDGCMSRIEHYGHGPWAHRLLGFYRHTDLST